MQFVQASAADDQPVWQLYQSCAAQESCCWTSEYPSTEILEIDLANGWLYVIYQEDALYAAASLLPTDDLEDAHLPFAETHDVCVLARLCLRPDVQGRGLGSALLQAIEALAGQQQKRAIHLLCEERNPIAHALYVRNGYRAVASIALYGSQYTAFEKLLEPSDHLR